jgi:hypothetical protein
MKKTLQDQYLLIKEGKGHKGVFLSEAKRQFPDIVRNAATFNEAAASLITKNIISENVIGLGAINSPFEAKKKQSFETAFESFLSEAKKKENKEEKVKAEEKKVSKPVEEDYARNFDRKDDKNIDNLIFDQVMTGYYAEMKDPKNADKTMQELKDIVMKNLQKDPIFYTKDGQFGVKGLGYTTEAPGLGTPKEVKGKYKSSGYGDLKEGVEKFMSDVEDLATKKGDKKFSPEEIKAKLAQKRKEELERRKKAGEPLEEITLREVIQTMIDEELNSEEFEDTLFKLEQPHLSDKASLTTIQKIYARHSAGLNSISQNIEENYESLDYYTSIISSNNMSEEDAYAYLEDQGLNSRQIDSIIDQVFPDNMGEAYQMPSVNTSGRGAGEGGKRFIPKILPFPQNIRKRFGEHIVYNPGSGTLYISDILYNNLVKGYANQPAIKKLIMDIPPMVKQILNKPDNYGPTTELPKEFRVYHPLNAEVEKAKSDQFNKAGDKQYWAESDFLIPNLNVMEEDTMESLREGVEKDLAAINKEAEHEVLQSKMEKIQALIDKKQSQISRLDEDEDMKNLTDDKKVKEISKDIKALEKAKAKLEKIMSKFKGKKPESKKVIDEMDNAEEAVSDIAPEYIEDANERLENGEEIDSILSNYQNLSFDDRNHLKNYLNWKQGEQPGLNSELGVEDEY